MSFEEVLKLPFEMQLVLAGGYIAHRIAATGLDRAHKTTDVVFQVLTYGLVTYVAYDLANPWVPTGIAMLGAILSAVVAASAWRAFGRQAFVFLIRGAKMTRENFSPSTWDHILHGRHSWAYIAVTRDDDVVFESNLQSLPEGMPFEPLDLDMDGNMAIYITRMKRPNEEAKDFGIDGALDQYGRAHLTYIPASRIKAVTFSFDTDLTP